MNIQHESDKNYGRFFYQDGDAEGELTYRIKEGILAIDHTGVDEKLEGKGVGKALVMRAVEWAREKGYKVKPYCPFASAVLHRSKEYADMVVEVEDL